VNDAARVGRTERARDLTNRAKRVVDRHRADAFQALVERFTFEQLHHEVGAAIDVVAKVEDLDDAGVSDRRGGARFVEESRHDLLIERIGGVQQLDRRAPADQRVLGEPDVAHSAVTDPRKYAIRTDLGVSRERARSPIRHHACGLTQIMTGVPISF
jgi:hypothetical protein